MVCPVDSVERGTQESLCGEAPPRGPPPYPFIHHFWQKRYPFRIPSILTNGTPFTYLVENLYPVYALSSKHEENHSTRKSSRLFHSPFKSFYSSKDRFPALLYTLTSEMPTL